MSRSAPRKSAPPISSAGSIAAPDSAASGSVAPSRGQRRKRETRQRLLQAAFDLMSQRGMDGVAIGEITEAADVGIGSFYNHFASKEAIYAAVMDEFFEEFGDALDRLVAERDDPAEILAISVRHAILRASQQPSWGQFLLREGFSARVFGRGLGLRLFRDIQRGIEAERFKVADPLMTFVAVGGGILAAIALISNAELLAPVLQQPSSNHAELAERSAAVLLQTLGLGVDEALQIAALALPTIETG